MQELRRHGITQFRDIDLSTKTLHQSKGLEADLVLLLDDPQIPDEHSLRELAFSQTSILGTAAGTYKQAMIDETYRLAYVALTRTRLAVMWVPLTERKGENGTQPAASDNSRTTVSQQGSFILVKEYMEKSGRTRK
jgi:ATP-dependent exoDNAse (exonuclease V) beta subunit